MFYASDLMTKHGVQAVFSDRQGGVSSGCFKYLNLGFDLGDSAEHVQQNLNILAQASQISLPHQARQVHGSQIMVCTGEGGFHQQDADILVASNEGVAVAVRTADCLPILLADKEAGVAAAVHAGWKGTVLQVVQKAVCDMIQYGAVKERILASLGPRIGSCCFEIDKDIAAQLSLSCSKDVAIWQGEQCFADLSEINFLQLVALGIRPGNIEISQICTSCSAEPKYFSYRRDKGKTGRQLAMIMLP